MTSKLLALRFWLLDWSEVHWRSFARNVLLSTNESTNVASSFAEENNSDYAFALNSSKTKAFKKPHAKKPAACRASENLQLNHRLTEKSLNQVRQRHLPDNVLISASISPLNSIERTQLCRFTAATCWKIFQHLTGHIDRSQIEGCIDICLSGALTICCPRTSLFKNHFYQTLISRPLFLCSCSTEIKTLNRSTLLTHPYAKLSLQFTPLRSESVEKVAVWSRSRICHSMSSS